MKESKENKSKGVVNVSRRSAIAKHLIDNLD